MAHFIGYVKGKAGQASRLGHRSTGLVTRACSWQGAIAVELYAVGESDFARVVMETWHGAGTNRVLYDGPVSGASAARARHA